MCRRSVTSGWGCFCQNSLARAHEYFTSHKEPTMLTIASYSATYYSAKYSQQCLNFGKFLAVYLGRALRSQSQLAKSGTFSGTSISMTVRPCRVVGMCRALYFD